MYFPFMLIKIKGNGHTTSIKKTSDPTGLWITLSADAKSVSLRSIRQSEQARS
ncbi:MAG: hypothetical protein ACJAZP_000412 [Psychromonas sp.]|jgi:hypothetical protein